MAALPFRNVLTADLSPDICDHGTCRSERNNVIIYLDSNHLTASFMKSLESALNERIDRILTGNATSDAGKR
jgi:hypothetical protein